MYISSWILFLTTFICGPFIGIIVAVGSDWLGLIFSHTKNPSLYFTLNNVIVALFPYYSLLFFQKISKKNYYYFFIAIGYIFANFLIITFNPLVLISIYNLNKNVLIYMYITRIIIFPITITINFIFFKKAHEIYLKFYNY
jgi:hypothetical protein